MNTHTSLCMHYNINIGSRIHQIKIVKSRNLQELVDRLVISNELVNHLFIRDEHLEILQKSIYRFSHQWHFNDYK